MKKHLGLLMGILTAAGSMFLSQAADMAAIRAAVENVVSVKEISGVAEYAYDSTGWRPLVAGKLLHPGASVRTGDGGMIVLAMEEPGSFVKIGSKARLDLIKIAPARERGVTLLPPLQAIDEKESARSVAQK
jgi:hypothetical protein